MTQPPTRPRVGPFELDRPLGAGAWGQVWRARHVGSGGVVAIKVLTHEVAHHAAFREAFQREARTVASLDHPAIVGVLDFGFADAAAAPLPEGSPLLVMEAAAGTLADLQGTLSWPELHALVARLLGALAHAHAHGVVHRDLKPRNVLVGCEAPVKAPHGLRLADFGISSGLGRADAVAGTPAYMAPEQIRLGPLGPWTDLYALGVVVWELVTGGLPFDADDPYDVLRSHLAAPLPPLRPRDRVPAELEGWLAGLLEKDPVGRTPSAGAALAAWRPLRDDLAAPWAPPAPSARRASIARTTILLDPLPDPDTSRAEPRRARPPLPADWRADLGERPLPLAEVGLGLLSLRSPPLVGRERERDELWAALTALRDPTMLWITGPAGVGSTRLARWLGVRAAETGAVEVLVGAPREAFTRWSGDDPVSLVRRLRADAWLAGPLAKWSSGGEEAPIPLLVALLEAAAREGPVLWVLEGEGQGALAQAVIAAADPGVPLAVVTHAAEDEPPPPGAQVVRLEPLAPTELETLLREVLALAPGSAQALREAAGGLPGVVLDLVRALASRGELVGSPVGFAFSGEPAVPVGAAGVWTARLGALATPERSALERVAAAHPDPVGREAWAAAGLDDAIVARLTRAGLVILGAEGIAIAHPTLGDVALAEARAAGRLDAHHLSWASRWRDRPERAGRHLLRAGRPLEALEPLRIAAEAEHARANPRTADRILGLATEAVRTAGLPATDPRALEVELLLGRNLLSFGRVADAVPILERHAARLADADPDTTAALWSTLANALRRLERFADAAAALDRAVALDAAGRLGPRAQVHVRMNRSLLLPHLGDAAGAERLEEEVAALAREIGAWESLAETLGRQATRAARRGDRARVQALSAQMEALLPELSLQVRGLLMIKLGIAASIVGDADAALRWTQVAHEAARASGDPVVLADALYHLAGQLEERGEADRALASLREALRWFRRLGPVPPIRRISLAAFLTRRGELEAARAELDEIAPGPADRRSALDVARLAWFAERAVLAALADPEDQVARWVGAFAGEVTAAGLRGAEIADAWTRIADATGARGLRALSEPARASAEAAQVRAPAPEVALQRGGSRNPAK